MCGIYGSTKFYSDDTIKKKLERMAFRGPDFSSFISIRDKLILGHNRLSIIDLDSRSNQPFEYEHLVIVFNGEIYNYKSIKEDLSAKKFAFYTTSDTEVICASYLAYGINCVEYFNGMFAFVIYDKKKNILFGARDPLGKKPFYYSLKNNYFEFASQISAITIDNSFSISDISINHYLLRGYVEDPFSIYDGIFKLKAGSRFVYDLGKTDFKTEQYWEIDYCSRTDLSYDDAKNQLRVLLEDAVRIRMIADVKVGVFFSGGIDSSLVAALAQAQSDHKVNSYSIKFKEDGFDESEYASAIAKHLDINHEIIPCDYVEGMKVIDEFNYYFDEPFADSSAVPLILLARHTKNFMTVALSGDGGDEIFLGYSRYRWLKTYSFFYRIPFRFRNIIGRGLQYLPSYRFKKRGELISKTDIYQLAKYSMISPHSHMLMREYDIATEFDYVFDLHHDDIRQKAADFDLMLWLCSDGLVKVDRATMASSVETRCPFLDHRVVNFGRSLPIDFRMDDAEQKIILKDILSDFLPESLFRRPKAGFTMPFRSWFRNELRDYVYDVVNINSLKGLPNINIPAIINGINEHMTGRIDFYPEIWRLLVLINWKNNNL